MHNTEQPHTPGRYSRFRKQALDFFHIALQAVDPAQAVKNNLDYRDERLSISLNPLSTDEKRYGVWSKIYLVAFGKAACTMMEAAQACIPESLLNSRCVALTNYENNKPVVNTLVLSAEHPVPDANGVKAAKIIVDLVADADRDELVLFLISGGGSALLSYPMEPLTLQDKIKVTELLLSHGATIHQINCIRKHLSALKGGRLAEIAAPAAIHTLLLSDVIDDDVSVIASGPTVADPSTYADAVITLKNLDLWEKIPTRAADILQQGMDGLIPETPKPDNPLFQNKNYTIIGSNQVGQDSIAQAAQALDYEVVIYNNRLEGEARIVAIELAQFAKDLSSQDFAKPTAIIAGGETTVTLNGNGQGGRNQEFALAFALAAEQLNLPNNWVLLSGGTDGLDGPTNAAGGLIDPETLERIKQVHPEPMQLLENNDSYHALQAASDLIITGATGTNVADLQILLINLPV